MPTLYSELVEEFFMKYEYPSVEELTVGFSDIDPPLKNENATTDHEELENLMGGDEDGHYHLTRDLWQKVIELLNRKDYDGGYASTSDAEYEENEDDWFDGGYATTTDAEYEENEEKWVDGGDADD